ncbi:hypothetical protein DLH72_01340 [Candidatus Gracilibacteria bacterium]|nr:MAG: hypothetical protein DLH72_01340 [Candidatus Gracilibacteria bacterium]
MKNKKAITLVELIVGISISMILMISIGIFASSGLSNIFLQEKNIGNLLDINDFSKKIKNNLDNIEKNEKILTDGIIFKRKTEYNLGGFSYIGTEEINNFYCENQKTKHIFIKNFIPYDGNNYEVILGDLKSNQKENKVFKNGNPIIGTNFYGYEFSSGEESTKVPLNGPTGLLKDNKGNIFVSDSLNNRILKREISGKTFHFIGEESGLLEPNGLFLDGDDLYIANSGKGEILKYFPQEKEANYKQNFSNSQEISFSRIKFEYIKKIGLDNDEKNFKIENNTKESILNKIKKTEIDYIEFNENNDKYEVFLENIGENKILSKTEFENIKNSGQNYKLLKIIKIFYFYTAKIGDNQSYEQTEITDSLKINQIINLDKKLELIIGKTYIYFDENEKLFYKEEISNVTNPGPPPTTTIVKRYFKINNFKIQNFSFDFPEFKDFGKGKFVIKIEMQKSDLGNFTISFINEKEIFANDVKKLIKVAQNLKYPYKINSPSSFKQFDLENPGIIKFDEKYDKILKLPIKNLDISKNGNIITILIKYYINYDCENLDSNEQKIRTLLLKKKIN